MRVVAVVGLVLFLLPQPALSQVPDDKLIVPGQRVGKWTLDATVDDLRRINGEPSASAEVDNPVAIARFVVFLWQPNPIAVFTRDGRKIVMIEVLAKFPGVAFRTEKGDGVGTTRPHLIAAYGEPTVSLTTGPHSQLDIYDEIGIAFSSTVGGLDQVYVFRLRSAKEIWKF